MVATTVQTNEPVEYTANRLTALRTQAEVFSLVRQEREHQDAKWGIQNHHPMEWLSILTEEVGEVARACNEMNWGDAGPEEYIAELTQVAAVAVAALECYKRNAVNGR